MREFEDIQTTMYDEGLGPFHVRAQGGRFFIMAGMRPVAYCAREIDAQVLAAAGTAIFDDGDPIELATEFHGTEQQVDSLREEVAEAEKCVKEAELKARDLEAENEILGTALDEARAAPSPTSEIEAEVVALRQSRAIAAAAALIPPEGRMQQRFQDQWVSIKSSDLPTHQLVPTLGTSKLLNPSGYKPIHHADKCDGGQNFGVESPCTCTAKAKVKRTLTQDVITKRPEWRGSQVDTEVIDGRLAQIVKHPSGAVATTWLEPKPNE